MRLSARNQLKGTIRNIENGAVNGIVKLETAGGYMVSSTISMSAIRELGLEPGKTAYAVIKATEVMMAEGNLRLSARNQFTGTVTEVNEGAVNGIVKLEIAGGDVLSSTISMSAIRELDLKPGKTATAVIKATSVMIGVED